jgi:hypothetical protein
MWLVALINKVQAEEHQYQIPQAGMNRFLASIEPHGNGKFSAPEISDSNSLELQIEYTRERNETCTHCQFECL